MFKSLVPERYSVDTSDQPDVDMLITCRGNLVFAWSSADEVIHVYDCEAHQQRARITDFEELWEVPTLEAFADHYVEHERLTLDEPTWPNHTPAFVPDWHNRRDLI